IPVFYPASNFTYEIVGNSVGMGGNFFHRQSVPAIIFSPKSYQIAYVYTVDICAINSDKVHGYATNNWSALAIYQDRGFCLDLGGIAIGITQRYGGDQAVPLCMPSQVVANVIPCGDAAQGDNRRL